MAEPVGVSAEDLDQLSKLFSLLADPTRLKILLSLATGERNVTALCQELRLPQPTVSHHLGLLRMNNIVANRRSGKQVFYHFNGRCDDNANPSEIRIHGGRYVVAIERHDEAVDQPASDGQATARDGAAGEDTRGKDTAGEDTRDKDTRDKEARDTDKVDAGTELYGSGIVLARRPLRP